MSFNVGTRELEYQETFIIYKHLIDHFSSANKNSQTVVQLQSSLQKSLCAALTWHWLIPHILQMFCSTMHKLHLCLFSVSFLSVCFKCTILNILHIVCLINVLVIIRYSAIICRQRKLFSFMY